MTENNDTPATPASDDAATADATQTQNDGATLPLTPPADTAQQTPPAAGAAAADAAPQASAPQASAESRPFWSRTGVRIAAAGVAGVALLGIGAGAGWAAHGELQPAGQQIQSWGPGGQPGGGQNGEQGDGDGPGRGASGPGENRGPHGDRDGDGDQRGPGGRDADGDGDGTSQDNDTEQNDGTEQTPTPQESSAS